MALGLVQNPFFQEHDPGSFHCESPQRLQAIDAALAKWPGYELCAQIPLRSATNEELGRAHRTSHLQNMAAIKGRAAHIDMDTGASPRSYEVALDAAGSLIDLCSAAKMGEVHNGMALIRPPGHHATTRQAMGFCLFNNAAVAATHLMEEHGLERILMVDWDVHHGNGSEEIFFSDQRVLYFSVHQSPLYPGTGSLDTVGVGSGEGYNINVPLPAGYGDEVYLLIFLDLLAPVARMYQPQFVIISGGFDSHREDPLGSMMLSSQGFAAMAKVINEIADEFCPGCVVMTLEGGYHPPAMGRSVVAVGDALMGKGDISAISNLAGQVSPPNALTQAQTIAGHYWKGLSR